MYETIKRTSGADQPGHHPLEAALSGAMAAVSHDFFMTPFDTVKQRMQLGHYRSTWHCLRTVLKSEGFTPLYRAFPATLGMNVPYGCIMVAVNESAKKILNVSDQHYNFASSMIAGAIAGASAAAITTPLDVIKTRLQTQHLEPCPSTVRAGLINNSIDEVLMISNKQPMGFMEIARNINVMDGWRGFFRGMTPRMISHAPAVAISWTAYEFLKNVLTGEK